MRAQRGLIENVSIDNSEANWNRRTDRQADGQDHVLSQADALTKTQEQNFEILFLRGFV